MSHKTPRSGGFASPIGLALLVAASPLIWQDAKHDLNCARARHVAIGDSRERVEAIVGKPDFLFERSNTLFFGGPERWAYGPLLDFEHGWSVEPPWFTPLSIRLFSPDETDVVVMFTPEGQVHQVTIPPPPPRPICTTLRALCSSPLFMMPL